MHNKKRSFFEKLTGGANFEDEYEESENMPVDKNNNHNWIEEENEEAELAVDVYETPAEIVIKTMVAGVKPEDLELSIGRDIITIKGKREESRTVEDEEYFSKELFWGSFSRTITLPKEVDPEEAEATEKHGLLTVRLQKIDKEKKANIKVKSV